MASNGTAQESTNESKRENIVHSHTSLEIPSDGEPTDQVEADPGCIPASSLRFEVCFSASSLVLEKGIYVIVHVCYSQGVDNIIFHVFSMHAST